LERFYAGSGRPTIAKLPAMKEMTVDLETLLAAGGLHAKRACVGH
jgi:hypothetical protein